MPLQTGLLKKILSYMGKYHDSEAAAATSACIAKGMNQSVKDVSGSLSAALRAVNGTRVRRANGRLRTPPEAGWVYWISNRRAHIVKRKKTHRKRRAAPQKQDVIQFHLTLSSGPLVLNWAEAKDLHTQLQQIFTQLGE